MYAKTLRYDGEDVGRIFHEGKFSATFSDFPSSLTSLCSCIFSEIHFHIVVKAEILPLIRCVVHDALQSFNYFTLITFTSTFNFSMVTKTRKFDTQYVVFEYFRKTFLSTNSRTYIFNVKIIKHNGRMLKNKIFNNSDTLGNVFIQRLISNVKLNVDFLIFFYW